MFGIKKPVWVFFGSFVLFYAGLGLYINIWPNYIRRLGASPETVGLLVGLSLLISTISYLPGGHLSDRFDRRKVTILSWWLSVPAPFIFAFARDWTALLPGIILYHFSSFGYPALLTYLSHATEPRETSFAVGFAFNFSALGMVFTPALGGYIARHWSFQTVFLLAGGLFLASTLILYLLDPQPPEAPHSGENRREPLPASFWIFTAAACLLFLGMNLFPPSVPQMLEETRGLNLAAIGLLSSFASVGAALMAPFTGWLAGRAGQRAALGLALLLVTASAALFAFGAAQALFALAFFCRGGQDALRTLIVTSVGVKASARARGAAFGTFNFISGLASSAGPLLGGLLYAQGSTRPFLAALLVLPLAGLAVLSQADRASEKPLS